MNIKLIDATIRKDKAIKNNLQDYNAGTNTTAIMYQEYEITVTLNGKQKKQMVKCCITLPPLAAEPVLQPNQSLWQTLPPT
jgi:hypothetical protein